MKKVDVEEELKERKHAVIKDSLWQVTVYASFQRAKIYNATATDADKRQVKELLRCEIQKKAKSYSNEIREAQHVKNIKAIADAINKKYASCLLHDQIPIGVVQKAFNLHLKLMWCTGQAAEPPHCPIDKVIIDKLPYKHRRSWTKIRDIETYKHLVGALKTLAEKSERSLAIWELEEYEKPSQQQKLRRK